MEAIATQEVKQEEVKAEPKPDAHYQSRKEKWLKEVDAQATKLGLTRDQVLMVLKNWGETAELFGWVDVDKFLWDK